MSTTFLKNFLNNIFIYKVNKIFKNFIPFLFFTENVYQINTNILIIVVRAHVRDRKINKDF